MSVYHPRYTKDGRVETARTYVIDFRDQQGDRRLLSSGLRDKASAQHMERMLVRLVDHAKLTAPLDEVLLRFVEGLPAKLQEKLVELRLVGPEQAAILRPLDALLDDWSRHLEARELSAHHRVSMVSQARLVVTESGAKRWGDLNADRVEALLAERREKGWSGRTSNAHLIAVRAFVAWAMKRGIGGKNPLARLERVAAGGELTRRALTIEESERFVAAAAAGPDVDGVSGVARALIYRVVLATGLRKNELATLLVSDLRLDGEQPRIRVAPENAKNRKEAFQPIGADLAIDLRAAVAGRLPTARAFTLPPEWDSKGWVGADLKSAGIEQTDAAGDVVDFHALRHTFITTLARVGVSLHQAMVLARHSDPKITSNVYTKLTLDDMAAAQRKLPEFGGSAQQAQSATGTEGGLRRGLQRPASDQNREGPELSDPAAMASGRDRAQGGPADHLREPNSADLAAPLAGESSGVSCEDVEP